MPVVTIRGLLGSGAPEIGKQVADRLHFDYVDREIISQVAARLRRQEQEILEKEMPPRGLLGRIAEALEHSYGFGDVSLPVWEMPLDDTQYLQSLQSIIRKLAAGQSIVIIGRGSQFILKDYPGALHVLVVAPLEVRIKRVMQNLKADEETARRQLTQFDSSVREFIKRYFHTYLEDPENYDLAIRTEHLSFDTAASLVTSALSSLSPSLSKAGPQEG